MIKMRKICKNDKTKKKINVIDLYIKEKKILVIKLGGISFYYFPTN